VPASFLRSPVRGRIGGQDAQQHVGLLGHRLERCGGQGHDQHPGTGARGDDQGVAVHPADVHEHHRAIGRGRAQVGERYRAQEVAEAIDPADPVHHGVPVPGRPPPLLEHPLLGTVHLIDVADGIQATVGDGPVQHRAGCLERCGQIRRPVP